MCVDNQRIDDRLKPNGPHDATAALLNLEYLQRKVTSAWQASHFDDGYLAGGPGEPQDDCTASGSVAGTLAWAP